MASAEKVHEKARKQWEHARRFWQPQNDLYGRLMAFGLDLEHYRQENGFQKSRVRIQPKTQRQFNLYRHKLSLLLRQEPQFDTHPVQPGADSHASEVTLRIVEQFFKDPRKAYHVTRYDMVLSALAGGRGCAAFDWHPKWGVCSRFVDPRRLHIQPGRTFLHDVLNPWTTEEVPMRMSELAAQKAWHIPRDLNPDNWKSDYATGGSKDSTQIDLYGGEGHRPGADESEDADNGMVTVLKTWYREDPFARVTKKERDADLPPDEWHWVDDSVQVTFPFDPENPVPPMSEVTGQPLRLVTSKRESSNFDQYEKGYLVITAPFYSGKKPLFEGSWTEGALNEKATLPSFPYMELVGYRNPLRRTGISDTELTNSVTVVDNATFRSTYEQVSTAGGILAVLKNAFKDSEGKPFRITSDPINIAHTDDPLHLERGMKFFQAPGMNPAMPQFRQMIADQWQHIGTGDFSGSLGPERSKDIAVGTANLIQQTGDLPSQLHAKDLGLQEAIGAAVVVGLSSAYMGDNVVSWVTDEGDIAYANVRGSDLVPLNVTVRTDKEWRQQDVDKVQALAQFLNSVAPMGLPPPVLAVMLRDAGFSPNIVATLSAAMQQAPTGPAQPGSGGGQGNGAPVPPQAGGTPPLSVVEGGLPT